VLIGPFQLIKRQTVYRTALRIAKRIFTDGGFGRIGGMLQANKNFLADSYFFYISSFIVLGQTEQQAPETQKVVLCVLVSL
jgi:hypothetical protein